MKNISFQSFFKRAIRWVVGLTILVAVFLIGETISGWIPFPIPGSVVGLGIIFSLLFLKVIPLKWVDEAAGFLLAFLGLFYVPYGVGIIEVNQTAKDKAWMIIVLAVTVSVLVMVLSGKLFTLLARKTKSGDE